MGNDFLLIPVILALLLGFLGMIGTWRRVIAYLVFGYAALIIACQYNAVVANMDVVQSDCWTCR